MRHFRRFLKPLLRYRAKLSVAVVLAFISAGGLGAGLVALAPILNVIVRDEGSMAAEVREIDAKLAGIIPDQWIAALPDDRFQSVLVAVVALGVLTLIGAAANFFHAYLSITVSLRTVADIRVHAFDRLMRLPLVIAAKGHGSDLLSRVISDTNALGRGFQAVTNKAIAQTTKGAFALAAAFIIEWRLSLITLAVAPLLFLVIRKLAKRIRRASKAAMRGQGRLLGVASEALSGLRVVKVHHTEAVEVERFTHRNEQVLRQQLKARTARALTGPLTELIAISALGTLALIAVKAIIDGQLEVENFIVALGSLAIAGQSLKPLNAIVQDLQVAEAAGQRIAQLIDKPTEDAWLGRGRPELPPHERSITFDHVAFSYDHADRPALDDVSLEINFGETVAFVGPNGSGKTTLLGLVPRLFDPAQGEVRIDDTDVATVDLASLREQMAVVTQETVLFRGSVFDNIAYGLDDPPRDHIIHAAQAARAHDFIQELPDAYDTMLGDAGAGLSGGQRQRLSIARAIARQPRILIMDEATSMIDAESEAKITEAVQGFAKGRTCLVVAHRLSTVVHADRIVVMDAGRIVDVGAHADLLDRCTLYRDLARHQLEVASRG